MTSHKTRNLYVVLMVFIVVVSCSGSGQAFHNLLTQFERGIGRGAAPELVKQYGGEYVLPIQERLWLDEIFRRLVDVTKRTEIEYTLTVLNTQEMNAFALPGGYIFVTRGLLRAVGNDESQVAAVLGHEIAHVECKHGLNAVLRQMGLTVLMEVGMFWLDMASTEIVRIASTTALQLLQLGWGREAEYEADILGQEYAVEAGFDGAGSVLLMDYLLQIESADQPLRVFRTHPESYERRERVAANLLSFWSSPQKISDQEWLEVLNSRRNSILDPRMDPMGRFVLTVERNSSFQWGLEIEDTQQDLALTWLPDHKVFDAAWSPDGKYLAVIVEEEETKGLWLIDRMGNVAKKLRHYSDRHVEEVVWAPQGNMVAMTVSDGTHSDIVVGYLAGNVDIAVSQGKSGSQPIWCDDGIGFVGSGGSYFVRSPDVQPVVIHNPVPRVVERKTFLSPTVIREGNTITLTRPKLSVP